MKDFHDVWTLSSAFAFEGSILLQSVVACFTRRRTDWITEMPDVLSSTFYADSDLQSRWSSYLRAGAFEASPPASFESIGERIQDFFGPLRDAVVAGAAYTAAWTPGGPWR